MMPPARLSPGHAALQSLLLPGQGQRKLGHDGRGTLQTVVAFGSMVLAVLSGYLTAWGVLPPSAWLAMLLLFLLALFTWTWSIFDAYALATRQTRGR